MTLAGGKPGLIVQCDFDDTVTVGNVSAAIRTVFGPEGLDKMEEDYLSGKYSVEESNIRQYSLVRGTREEMEDFVLGDTVVRYAFDEFVEYCRGEGIRLAIVSSGLDLYIAPIIGQLGFDHLEVYSAQACVTPEGVTVEYREPGGGVITRGFKESYLRHFKAEGHTVVYIGDGLSDIVPASEADFVIARATLESHCRTNDLPHYSFETFTEVGRHVEEIRGQAPG